MLPMPNTSYAVEWDDLWTTKNQQAQQAFKDKQFDKAAEKFESQAWKAASQYKAGNYEQAAEALSATESDDGFYNKGNAHAKLGDYEKAIESYEQALQANPNNADAKHNLKLVEDAQNEQKKNQQKDDKGENQEQDKGDSQNDSSSDGEQQDSDKGEEKEGETKKPEESKKPEKKMDEDGGNAKDEPANESDPSEEDAKKKRAEKTMQQPLSDEKKQAAEQWLNRLEDDPAGLLKRKFKYQYGQRRQK